MSEPFLLDLWLTIMWSEQLRPTGTLLPGRRSAHDRFKLAGRFKADHLMGNPLLSSMATDELIKHGARDSSEL